MLFWGSYLAIAIIVAAVLLVIVRKLLFTLIILIASMALFFLTLLTGSGYISDSIVFWELGFNPADLANGINLYTLVTSLFIHANMIHLIFNMVWFVLIGMTFEDKVGRYGLAVTFLITGIIGNVVFAVSFGFKPAIVIGASGAIYGIFGAFVRLYPMERLRIYFLGLPAYQWFLIFMTTDLLLSIIQPFFSPLGFIAFTAHLGGLIGGFLLSPFIIRFTGIKKQIVKLNPDALEPIAKTPYLREMLQKINDEEDPAIQRTWLDEFLKQAECPECGGKMIRKFKKVSCGKCNFSIKTR